MLSDARNLKNPEASIARERIGNEAAIKLDETPKMKSIPLQRCPRRVANWREGIIHLFALCVLAHWCPLRVQPFGREARDGSKKEAGRAEIRPR